MIYIANSQDGSNHIYVKYIKELIPSWQWVGKRRTQKKKKIDKCGRNIY